MQIMIKKDEFKFAFNPKACEFCDGRCCKGESGYIWLNPKEMQNISEFLGLAFEDFTKQYVKKVGYKYSLIEKKNNNEYECIFFDSKTNRCKIYEVRPTQCKTYPFWESFKKDYKEVKKECPGIILL